MARKGGPGRRELEAAKLERALRNRPRRRNYGLPARPARNQIDLVGHARANRINPAIDLAGNAAEAGGSARSTGAAFVDQAEFLGDPGAEPGASSAAGSTNPGLQGLALLGAHFAWSCPPISKRLSPSTTPLCSKSSYQPRIVSSSNKKLRPFLTAHTLIQQHQRVGAPRSTTGRQTIARQRDQRFAILFNEKAA